ncbi:hypothetical protein ACTFIW_001430 [Dictyostelium discoideum]
MNNKKQKTENRKQQRHQQQQQQQQLKSITDEKPKAPTLTEIFNDLSSRFVLNIPAEELSSFERLLFQIETAYWFYDDFYKDFPQLPKYSMGEFTKNFFMNCPILKAHQSSVEEILKKFSEYKTNLEKALFVRGYGSNNSWGFPKGKVNKDEPDSDCAIREVFEETSFDISPYLNERHYIELNIKEHKIKLYIIAGVPEETYFYPRTRKEIGKIEWVVINDLPTIGKKISGSKERNFYRSFPFFNRLCKWVQLRKLKYPKELYATTPNNNNNQQQQQVQQQQQQQQQVQQVQQQVQQVQPQTPNNNQQQQQQQNITPKSNNKNNNNNLQRTTAPTTIAPTTTTTTTTSTSTTTTSTTTAPTTTTTAPQQHHYHQQQQHQSQKQPVQPITILTKKKAALQAQQLQQQSQQNNLLSTFNDQYNKQKSQPSSYPIIPESYINTRFNLEKFNVQDLSNHFKTTS